MMAHNFILPPTNGPRVGTILYVNLQLRHWRAFSGQWEGPDFSAGGILSRAGF